MGKIYYMDQGTEEWFEIKRGKVSSSRVSDILPGKKGDYLASRKNYMAELACEILTGTTAESYHNESMRWGTKTEPFARTAYEVITGEWVDEVGFIEHGSIPGYGASTDGLVGLKGLLEIKCPNTATHIHTLFTGKYDHGYFIQMQSELDCAERDWADFVSYDPRLLETQAFYRTRVYRDDVVIKEIHLEVMKFRAELDVMVERLQSLDPDQLRGVA